MPPAESPRAAASERRHRCEPRYLRFKADETQLSRAQDDGRYIYLEFSSPAAADLEFFDQDGRPLTGSRRPGGRRPWAACRHPGAPGRSRQFRVAESARPAAAAPAAPKPRTMAKRVPSWKPGRATAGNAAGAGSGQVAVAAAARRPPGRPRRSNARPRPTRRLPRSALPSHSAAPAPSGRTPAAARPRCQDPAMPRADAVRACHGRSSCGGRRAGHCRSRPSMPDSRPRASRRRLRPPMHRLRRRSEA